MEFVANVNITMKEYNELKRADEKLTKILESMNRVINQVHEEDANHFIVLNELKLTINAKKLTMAIYGHRKVDITTIKLIEN